MPANPEHPGCWKQAKELTRALDIESVLCLADRTPLGRVEEVRWSEFPKYNPRVLWGFHGQWTPLGRVEEVRQSRFTIHNPEYCGV